MHNQVVPTFDILNLLNDLRIEGKPSSEYISSATSAQQLYNEKNTDIYLNGIGSVTLPYFSMGVVSSKNLLSLNELIIFAIYLSQKNVYQRCLDLGANVGLHSVILEKLGMLVDAYEPDDLHHERLLSTLLINNCVNVNTNKSAVTTVDGIFTYVQVQDNLTSSHIKGATGKNPYGPLNEIEVKGKSIRKILNEVKYDIVKMDVEGYEMYLLNSLSESVFFVTDFIIEIGSEEARLNIFNQFKKFNSKIKIYSQKIDWNASISVDDLPCSHKEGSVFISARRSPFE